MAANYGSSVLGYDGVLRAADKDYRAIFTEQLEETRSVVQPIIDLLSFPLTSRKKSIQLSFLGAAPQMQEWIQDRIIERLTLDALSISSKSWANGIELDGDDVEGDDMDLYRPAIRSLAEEAVFHQRDLLADLLNAGFGTTLGTAYDGLTFFNAAHKRPGTTATYSNATDDILDQGAYQAAITRLRQVPKSDTRDMNLQPTHLIVAANLEWTARNILQQATLATGETNITQGTAQLVVMNQLTSGYWFVADMSRVMRPLILFTKRPIRPDQMISTDSPNVFHQDKYFWGASWKGNAGYGLPELIQGSDGTGT